MLLPVPRRSVIGEQRVPVGEARVAVVADLPAQGYRLRVNSDGVAIDVSDAAGEFYARQTLGQLTTEATAPECDIEDWPDLPIRGVMLDVSRDKVPTMETLFDLVDRLAGWKLNELQLYMEHTYAYVGHEDVWRDASPFTAEEIRDLDEYCAARHITLTPNQNCLGHMERWLRHPRYRDLGLTKEPFSLAGIMRRPPMTMDPSDPASLALVRDLLSQLLPNFRSGRVHVGLDEPFELPEDRYGEYVDYLVALRAAPELDGKQMLVWGDILATHPELIERLPDGVTVAEWGYEAGHPFADRLSRLDGAWVCPGTSAWNSLFGRTTNMRENQLGAAAAGGAAMLTTDWGDGGHLQYLPASYAGFAHSAAVAWCLETNRDVDLREWSEWVALGDAYCRAERQTPNMASYLLPLWLPHLRRAFITNEEADAIEAHLDKVRAVSAEAITSVALAKVLIDDARGRNDGDGSLSGIDEALRRKLAGRLDEVIEAHRGHWAARNRPGGLADSVSWLERLRDSYRSGTVDPDWLPPSLRTVTE